MRKSSLILVSVFLCLSFVSAATRLNIYLDNKGGALFLGNTNENIQLPDGITLDQGAIKGSTNLLTNKQGNEWSFSYKLSGANITVILPDGAVLDSYSRGEIYLDRGQIAIADSDNIQISYHIERVNDSKNIIWFVSILLIIILIYIYYTIRKKNKDRTVKTKLPQTDKIKMLSGVLSERENLILDKLNKVNRAKMSYLRKQTDIPKAAFSRHIHELERKKLVKLSGEGKNKFVSLR